MVAHANTEIGMAYTLLWNENPRVLHLRFTGALTEAAFYEARDVVERFWAERGHCPVIVDFSSISEFDLSIPVLQKIARGPVISDGSRIMVAPRPLVFGSARMVQLIRESTGADDPELRIVREVEDAYTILGVSTPEFRCVSTSDGPSAAVRGE
jgi:hypothetical protein